MTTTPGPPEGGEPLDEARMLAQLELHEGIRLRLYRDTKQLATIGIGYNVDARGVAPLGRALGRAVTLEELVSPGLTRAECEAIARADIQALDRDLLVRFPVYRLLSEVRKRVVVDVVFCLGERGAAKFVQGIHWLEVAVAEPDRILQEACYTAVAYSLMDSLYARDVGDGLGGRYDRADRLATMMRTGQDYTR